jgi:hypothetical protein
MFTKNSSWQVKQSIPHTAVTLYSNCENVRRLRLELWRQKNWLLHHGNAPSHISFLTTEVSTKNNMTVVPHSPYFSLFPRLKIKLKGRHFDIAEVMEAELRAVLNTLTQHDFQHAFKTWQEGWEQCIRAESDYFEGDGWLVSF